MLIIHKKTFIIIVAISIMFAVSLISQTKNKISKNTQLVAYHGS